MKFLKLTKKSGGSYLLNIRHIIRVIDATNPGQRYVVMDEADTAEANQMLEVTETLYQIEQALEHIAKHGGYAVAVPAHFTEKPAKRKAAKAKPKANSLDKIPFEAHPSFCENDDWVPDDEDLIS